MNTRSIRRLLWLSFFVSSFYCCTPKVMNEVTPIEFTNQVNVSHQEIYSDFLFSYPNSLLLTDSCFIILDDKGHKFYYHLLNRSSGLLESEFAVKGQGLEEIVSTSENPFFDKDKNEISFFDRSKRNINYYNLSEHRMTSRNIYAEASSYNIWIHELFDLGEYYLSLGMQGEFEDNRFIVFDKDMLFRGVFENYPQLSYGKDKNKDWIETVFNIYFFRVSPNRKNAVFASYKAGFVEFFNLEDIPHNIHRTKSLLLTEIMKNGENIWGFEDVCATDNFVYLLHNGYTSDENPYYSKSIKVFDWNGDPVIEYRTEIDMRCIAVDEEKKVIYAIGYTPDDKGYFLIQIDDLSHL